ncbi:Uma2 family endonuclease [Nonomuraea sp. NN258]|uniref:Uma2 family endonuclease n=1 Tax=Nonomuraea antri TaxID=2730852 RepID=UPI00156A34EB|nr:Uma2 family endonuclease [Nonomuraea antri]NRQ35336.1 Uma2 family endonuclease [Nonomuraea antri]
MNVFGIPEELSGPLPDISQMILLPPGGPGRLWIASNLGDALRTLRRERGWRAAIGTVDVRVEPAGVGVTPAFVLWPLGCPLSPDAELTSTGVIMVAEVVAPGTAERDRDQRPRLYARGGVPVCLVIDPVAEPASVTVHHEPADGGYRAATRVPVGAVLRLPEPVGVDLDTSAFRTRAT